MLRPMAEGSPGWSRARRSTARDRTREAIVDAALRLFDQRGYIGVRVEDIANDAGVSRATFYKHFAEREEILGELFGRLLGGATPHEGDPDAAAGPDATDAVSHTDDIEGHVVAMLSATMTGMLADERLARFVYSLPIRHDAVLPGGDAVPAVFEDVRASLVEAMESGAVRSDLPVERTLEVLGRVFEASMRDWVGQGVDPQERLRELASIVFRGVTTG